MFNPTWGNWCSNLTIFWQSYGLVQPPTRKHHGVFFDLFFLGRMELLLAPFNIKSWYPPSRNFRRQPEMSGLFQGFLKKNVGIQVLRCDMRNGPRWCCFLADIVYPPVKDPTVGGGSFQKEMGRGRIDEFFVHKNIKWSMCPFKGCYNYTPPNETNRSNSIMF